MSSAPPHLDSLGRGDGGGCLELQPEWREGTLRDREGGVFKTARTPQNWYLSEYA